MPSLSDFNYFDMYNRFIRPVPVQSSGVCTYTTSCTINTFDTIQEKIMKDTRDKELLGNTASDWQDSLNNLETAINENSLKTIKPITSNDLYWRMGDNDVIYRY